MNVVKCPKCHYSLISEELGNHVCKEIQDYKIKDGIVCFFDGELWYPSFFLKQPKSNTEKTTDDETEPDFSIVLYYALRKSRYNGIRLRCFTSSQARKRS